MELIRAVAALDDQMEAMKEETAAAHKRINEEGDSGLTSAQRQSSYSLSVHVASDMINIGRFSQWKRCRLL